MPTLLETRNYQFTQRFEMLYDISWLLRADGSTVTGFDYFGPCNCSAELEGLPQVDATDLEPYRYYFECAVLAPGEYWHYTHDNLFASYDHFTVEADGSVSTIDGEDFYPERTLSELLQLFAETDIPRWFQHILLGAFVPGENYRNLLKDRGYPDIGWLTVYSVHRTANDSVWVHLVNGQAVYADLYTGEVWSRNVPRKLKKALLKPRRDRLPGDQRRISNFLNSCTNAPA